MVRYRYPKPVDGEPIHHFPEPVPVEFGWPISGSYQPRMTGFAVAWQGDKETGVTLVRLHAGGEGWVETTSIQRLDSPTSTKPGEAPPAGPPQEATPPTP